MLRPLVFTFINRVLLSFAFCIKVMGLEDGGDPEKGKKLFMQRCGHCHTVEQGGKQNHAPSLYRVVGRKAGSAPGYSDYTEANKNKSKSLRLFVAAVATLP